MYNELIKRLRERSDFLFPHHGESRSYDADLMHEAADAIEALTEENERLRKAVLRYEDELGILDTLPLVDQREPPKEETIS